MMKTCPKCAESIQNAAIACPHCNYTPPRIDNRAFTGGVVPWIVGAAIVGGVLAFAAANERELSSSNAPFTASQMMVEEQVKAHLRDPRSATFRHLGNGCGYVNSRNGFGGMSGFQRFIIDKNNVFLIDNDSSATPTFDVIWDANCAKGLAAPGGN